MQLMYDFSKENIILILTYGFNGDYPGLKKIELLLQIDYNLF